MRLAITLFATLFAFTFLIGFSSCNKHKNRTTGVCYCDFANGQKQEYDLTHLPRQDQVDTCNNHSNNAANFGGVCELE